MKFARCASLSSLVLFLSFAFLATGCGSVGASNPTPTPVASPGPGASPTPTPVGNPSPTPTPTPTATTSSFVYVGVNGTSPNHGGSILGFQLNHTTGALTPIAGSPFAADDQPSAMVSDPQGRFLFIGESNTVLGVRNGNCVETSGAILSEAIDPATGKLTQVQSLPIAGACPFTMVVDPTGKFLYVTTATPNLGTGQIQSFSISSTGTLTELPGSPLMAGFFTEGLAIHPSGKYVYATNPDLTILDRDTTTGALTLRTSFDTAKTSVTLNPAGDLLIASESFTNETTQFHVDATTGNLTPSPTRIPIGTVFFAADPLGAFFVGIENNDPMQTVRNLTTFKLDTTSNEYVSTNAPAVNAGAVAVDAAFEPQGKFVYSVQLGGNTIAGFALDRTTGALIPIASKPIAVPASAIGLAIVTPQ